MVSCQVIKMHCMWKSINELCNDLTPLQVACLHGHSTIIKILLNHEAEVNIQNSLGNTALHYAYMTELSSIKCGRQLLNAHANTDIQNHDGLYPWEFALCLHPMV